jgi:Carboxypeptidase regulatory-like domain
MEEVMKVVSDSSIFLGQSRHSIYWSEEAMQIPSLKLVLVLFLVVGVGSSLPAWAQSTSTGTVAGSVTDPTGAMVAGAVITLIDIGTNTARPTTTNASGRYVYVDVNPGIYSITVSKAGFATTKTENQEVKVGASLTIDLSLQVGGSNVVVEVTAVGNELQTMNATVGNTITGLAIDSLPSLGRDVSTFVELQPGVGPDGAVGGAVLDQSYFTLDGGNNSNDMDGSMNVYTTSYAGDPTGGVASQNQLGSALANGTAVGGPTGVIPTPADSIEEFKVNTAGQTADFNSSAGAEVKIVTKRGTSAWHGTGYEYYKDNNWSSNSWENNHTTPITPIPSFHYSRYGGAIGGPVIPKDILGGKTYLFFNYEGFNFPASQTVVRNVPSPNLRNGIITDPTTGTQYHLKTIDPLGIGLNPIVSQIWNRYEPQPTPGATCLAYCDGVNVLGFSGNVSLPTTSKFVATRMDHDFSSKWHFMSTYHYFKINAAETNQVDIGGFFPGDRLGTPASRASLPEQAWMWVAALTTNISSNFTNDFHYSFLRNWWAYNRTGDTPPLPGLGGALEVMGEQLNGGQEQNLMPYNVDTQNTRTRFWDGHDQMFRDDLSLLKGNHLFQFGGTYQHNFNWHQRTDNGGGINYAPVYELGEGAAGSGLASDLSICATTKIANCGALTTGALGIVSIAQTAYTRSGPNLRLNPPLTPAFDQSTIPYYNVYFTDTWHMKPTFTLTYGLGWTLEMPPVEANGKQVALVDTADQPVSAEGYLVARKRAALLGQNYNPELGFALVGNTGSGLKYPYNPYYGEFSPRIAAAWSPRFDSDSIAGEVFGHEDTVIRAGYGRQYGRLNGVDLVLVPLLGTGLIQPVQCIGGLATQSLTAPCAGGGVATPATAFRIGVNGLTAPLGTPPSQTLVQPDFPGFNAVSAGAGEALDPNFRPNQIDSFDVTIQRQLSKKVTLELGYIGRRIENEYQPINLNAVPYMMTKGGQQFSNAYANVVMQYCGGFAGLAGGGCAKNAGAVTPQPFFEKAMNPAYCAGFANCTDAVVKREGGNFATAQVWSLWSDLDSGASCTGCPTSNGGGQGFVFGNTMMNTTFGGFGQPQNTSGVGVNASVGHGNYNGVFVSLKMADFRGFTAQSNFTWSKALGTGGVVQASSAYTPDDPFDLNQMYGRQAFDHRYVYNMFIVYQPPFYKGQSGLMGRLLGGWTFGTVFTAGSGAPSELYTSTGDGQEFGAGDNINFFGNENAIPINPITSGHIYSQPNGAFPNIFKAGPAAVNDFRNPILGMDTRDGGYGMLNGLPYWNMDLSVKKNIRVAESISLDLQGVFANFLNHNQWLDPDGQFGSGLFNPGGFGELGGSAQEQPGGNRQIEVGIRVRF